MEEKQSLPQLFEKYLQYCIVIRNYTPITIRGYKSTLNLFFNETQCLLPEQVTKNIVENWFFNGRLNRKWGAVTFSHYHKHLNKFFDWLLKQNIIAINPALQIEKPRLEQKLPRTVSKAQGQLILDASYHMKYSYTFERYRNHAIIGLMLLAGLRKGEILKLRLQDISIDTKTIFINQGKGHKDRLIPINLTLQRLLVEYLKDRARLKRKSIFFFTTLQKDAPISNQCIKLLIHKLRKKTKIDFSSHTLRHGFARLMLEGGCDIYTLSKLMGHSKITTTTIYLSCSSQQMSKSIELHALN